MTRGEFRFEIYSLLGRTFVVLRDHINCRQMEEIASRTRTLIAPRRRPKTRSQAQREPRSVSLPSNGQGRDERPLDNDERPIVGLFLVNS